MAAIDLFHDGLLGAAVEAQLGAVKAAPSDPGLRLFLAELLAFAGDLDRARRQIDTIPLGVPHVDNAVRELKGLLDAESARRKTFEAGDPPQFFGDPPEHVALRREGLARLRDGAFAEAAALLGRANEAVPDLPGTLDGRAFSRLRDTDDRLAGVLEVFAMGKYYWVPLEQVVGLAMNPPRFSRDLLFIPARLELAEQSGEVFLPALYPGASGEADDRLRLGRLTEWRAAGDGGPAVGVGAKVFQLDDDDVALIDWRQLVRSHAAAEASAAPAGAESGPEGPGGP